MLSPHFRVSAAQTENTRRAMRTYRGILHIFRKWHATTAYASVPTGAGSLQ